MEEKAGLTSQLLREKAPYSRPNTLMIQLENDLLSLNGKLIQALKVVGEPDYEATPEPFVLNVV